MTTNIEGRMNDGWAYALLLKNGETIRVCDSRSPETLWSSIARAKSQEKPGVEDVIVFSGAREIANGKVDGMAFISASEIVALRNWGPSVLGLAENRLAKLEEEVAKQGQAILDHKAAIEELEADLDEEDEGQDQGATITPIPGVETVPTEAAEALASAADDEDEG